MRDYAVFTINRDGYISDWGGGAESIYGYADEEIIGQPTSIFFTPEDISSGASDIEFKTAESKGRADGEGWQVRKDGTRFWGSSVIVPLTDESGNLNGFVKVTCDITKRKHAEESLRKGHEELEARAEERSAGLLQADETLQKRIPERERVEKALRESEERYRAFVVNSSEAIWRFALEQPLPLDRSEDELVECFYQYGYLAECNVAMARMYSFSSPDEMIGIRLGDIVVSSNPENIAFLRNFIRSGYRLTDAETVELDKEGNTKYFLNNLVGIVEGGFILGAWGTNRDITERTLAKEALRKSEERFRIAAELASDLIYELDIIDGHVKWFGNVAEHLGYEPEELLRTVEFWEQALHPSDHDRVMAAIERHLVTGEPLEEEYRIRRKDEMFLYWIDRRRVLQNENGASKWIGVISNITPRKQAEELEASLRSSELMAALGSLVAGVAHEVRNPLFGISSVLDAFEARFGGRPEHQPYIDVLREELGHLNRLMEDLLDYGTPYSKEFRERSIYDAVVSGVATCEPLAKQRQVMIVNKALRTLAPIMMDEKRLPQVFSNMIKNAIQHSSPGATVYVEAEEISLDNLLWIECRVKDSGPGFQIEDLPQIFDPFFTRRRGGTGLGLSIVQRIVQEHGGKIMAGNRSEGGAEIVVRIPVWRGSSKSR
jgi:PAS domain S-box-containing protein